MTRFVARRRTQQESRRETAGTEPMNHGFPNKTSASGDGDMHVRNVGAVRGLARRRGGW